MPLVHPALATLGARCASGLRDYAPRLGRKTVGLRGEGRINSASWPVVFLSGSHGFNPRGSGTSASLGRVERIRRLQTGFEGDPGGHERFSFELEARPEAAGRLRSELERRFESRLGSATLENLAAVLSELVN